MDAAVKQIEDLLGIPNPVLDWQRILNKNDGYYVALYSNFKLSVFNVDITRTNAVVWEVWDSIKKFPVYSGNANSISDGKERALKCLIGKLL